MAFILSPEAEIELDRIWDYIASVSGSLETADRVIDKLVEHFYLLANHPHIGRRRDDDLRPGIRSFPVGRHIILYQIDDEDVHVLHVFGASRSVDLLFGF